AAVVQHVWILREGNQRAVKQDDRASQSCGVAGAQSAVDLHACGVNESGSRSLGAGRGGGEGNGDGEALHAESRYGLAVRARFAPTKKVRLTALRTGMRWR